MHCQLSGLRSAASASASGGRRCEHESHIVSRPGGGTPELMRGTFQSDEFWPCPPQAKKNHGFEPHIGKILLASFLWARVFEPHIGNSGTSSHLLFFLCASFCQTASPRSGASDFRSPSIVGCFLFPAASRRMHLRNSSGLRLHRPPYVIVSSWGGRPGSPNCSGDALCTNSA